MEVNELFNIQAAVEQYSDKKGYTEGVKYYHKIIINNQAVRHSDYFNIVKKFDKSLKEFVDKESTTALADLTTILPEYYCEDGELPDVFIAEGLQVCLDNISEYLMHLRKLYNLDLYM